LRGLPPVCAEEKAGALQKKAGSGLTQPWPGPGILPDPLPRPFTKCYKSPA